MKRFFTAMICAALILCACVKNTDTENTTGADTVLNGSPIPDVTEDISTSTEAVASPPETVIDAIEAETGEIYGETDSILDDEIVKPIEEEPESNERGNTTGNISNVGSAAFDGEWVYYRSNKNGSLYKMKPDGTEAMLLVDESVRYINVLNGWVYFKNWDDGGALYKIRTDGSDKTKLNNDESNSINVVGNWVYYSAGFNAETGEFGCLYKIRTDGSQKTQLNNDWSDYINVVDGWIYYCNRSDNGYLYKMKTDGTEKEKLNEDESIFINVADNWIYYGGYDGTGGSLVYYLYKIRTDGTERTKLNNEYSMYINVSDGWVYYNRSLSKMCKINTDGTETMQFEFSAKDVNIINGWIYHYFDGKKDSGYYRVRTDGTERQLID